MNINAVRMLFLGSLSKIKEPYLVFSHLCLYIPPPHSIPSYGYSLEPIFMKLGKLKCHAHPDTETSFMAEFVTQSLP